MSIHKPQWFREDKVMISTASTCGISKSGGNLVVFDATTGTPTEEIDDRLLRDMEALTAGRSTETLQWVDVSEIERSRIRVPAYYDRRYHEAFIGAMNTPQFAGFSSASLSELVEKGWIVIRNGHGSAPKDLRKGDVPYIKVSDLRAGLVNINPTNRVPRKWAEKMWRGANSGLQAYDLLSPERASKNIGDFCVLMPGQEQILLTKEIIVLRAAESAPFDQFYLLWAMTLTIVRQQWNRVVFMQTNREDVGSRFLEIEVPIAPSRERANEVSAPFRDYYLTLSKARADLRHYLDRGTAHHFFISGAEQLLEEDEPVIEPSKVDSAKAAG